MRLRDRIAAPILRRLRASGALTVLVAGRTGCGKSSTVNSLLGQEAATISPHARGTDRVTPYPREIGGIELRIIDTPGLGDPDPLQEKLTLAALGALDQRINSLLYVTAMDHPREDTVDWYTFRILFDLFPDAMKERSTIVLTRADLVPEGKYAEKRHRWLRSLQGMLARVSGMSRWSARDVPAVVIANGRRLNPDGEEWLEELLVTVVERSDRRADIQPVLMARKD